MTPQQAFEKTTGLTLKKGIEKAIEGGWQGTDKETIVSIPEVGRIFVLGNDPLLDTTFWQSLGRALGWGGLPSMCYSWTNSDDEAKKQWRSVEMWLYQQHRFIDHLNEESPKEDTR